MTATCETCRFHDMPNGGRIGTCRRHSPSRWGWGLSYPHDWCGEHVPKALAVSGEDVRETIERMMRADEAEEGR